MLWEQKGQLYSAGRKRMPLHKSLSFWLEILCALFLSIAIAEPTGCSSTSSKHSVFIIDASASMQANQYWNEIEQTITQEIRNAKRDTLFTLIRAGHEPLLLAGPKVEASLALSSLKEIHPYDSFADLEGAIELASTLTFGAIALYTDQIPLEPPSSQIDWNSTASPAENIGIIKAKRKGTQVDISLWNASDKPNSGKLILEYAKDNQETKELQFKPDELIHMHFSTSKPSLQARFIPTGTDALSLDNQIFLLPSESRKLKIAVDMEERAARTLGFIRKNNKTAPLFRIADGLIASSPMDSHILFTDRNIGGSPDTWRLSVHSSKEQRQTIQNSMFINHRHPLLQDVSLNNVIWNYSSAKNLRGTPLIQSGMTPLLTEEIQNKGERKVYHINIDPILSTLHQHQSWPIFLAGLLEERRNRLPGLVASNLKSHQNVQILDATPGAWAITTPSKKLQQQHSGGLLQLPAQELGLYTFTLEQEVHQASVNLLSRSESDLRSRGSTQQQSQENHGELSPRNSSMISFFLILTLLGMAWDWRVTEEKR